VSATTEPQSFGRFETVPWIAVPEAGDDKYSRGVLGVVTGSDRYPGAAVLGVEAAVRTGLGMVRYLGGAGAADHVLRRRPEVVTADGRVQAWLLGSGMSKDDRDAALESQLIACLQQHVPIVLDAGALDLAARASGPVLLTPHFGELATLLGEHGIRTDKATIAASPAHWARVAGETTGATVLLKGATTYLADATGVRYAVQSGPAWAATAGSGDALGGVLGALVATHAAQILDEPSLLAEIGAAGAWIHGEAGRIASAGGPIAALDIAEAVPAAIRSLLAGA
jgi:ADP-dependent NAD(P)H-hydrate dehydratase / NAD(P)H-hydrate epimerase